MQHSCLFPSRKLLVPRIIRGGGAISMCLCLLFVYANLMGTDLFQERALFEEKEEEEAYTAVV